MQIPNFKLEEFWEKHEFTAPYLLCCSDAESWTMQEIIALADPTSKQLWDSLTLGYTEPPGHPLLRKEIAQLYTSLHAEQILTFVGAEEGIYCTMRTLVNPGDHVLVIDPCYQSLRTLPQTFGADTTSLPLKVENQWQLDLDEITQAFRKNTKLVVLNYPHNPTGALLDKEVLEGLIALARKSGAYIFCDEVYRYMEIDESQRQPAMADLYEKGISLNVMTKSFGLAGLRIGWLATQEKTFLKKALSYKLYTSICNSAPSEILAIIALRAKEQILQRNRELMLKNLRLLDEMMERNKQFLSWIRPQSGTIAIVQLLLPIPVEQFAEKLLQAEGVLIMPGSVVDLPSNFFRIGFGRKNMPEILRRFEKFLEEHARLY